MNSIGGERYMRMALRLAARARGQTDPNPMVGAVVVRSGRIVGHGYHRKAGQPHAEVFALQEAGVAAQGATLYVSLEPCAHTGRTPPCTEAIRKAGIRNVIAAMIDPNPLTRGRGLKWLKARGIGTSVGLLEPEARSLNQGFITRMQAGRPFVTIKAAQSLDGKIATASGESRWITGPAARQWVHRLRAESDAILVGVETVLKDDPRLTVRSMHSRSAPVKIILDSSLRTPPASRLFSSGSPVWIAATSAASAQRERLLRRAGAEILRLPDRAGRVDLGALLKELARREISRLLIEGGGEVIASALQAKAVDRVIWMVAPKIIGGRDSVPVVGGKGVASLKKAILLENVAVQHVGSDLLITGDVRFPGSRDVHGDH